MTSLPSHPGFLLVLVGPSGVGKSTISRRLAEAMHITYAVSATTRVLKKEDVSGKTYEHVSSEEFFRRLDADQFLEYAQVYGDYYGTPKHPTLDLLAAGKDVLLEIDVQGALQVRNQYPNALLIFILPPDEPTLLQRLKDRGRDSAEEISRRFRAAKREIDMARGAKAFDFWVINDEVERAVREICEIVQKRRRN
ncbi:MAG: guanylate kinase [Tepidisphaeraceae bacterium]|jgi:guanylate kinase